MPMTHIFLAILVAIIWGMNFLFVKLGLEEISPLLLCASRFLLSCFPAILFFKPPNPFKIVAAYGLIMFGLQFSLVFFGMKMGMTAGMASLVMQVQVFFSMLFAALFLSEKPHLWQIVGAIISFLGISLVAVHTDKSITMSGFILILASAATWGIANLITKKATHINKVSLVVWGSFVACIPLTLLVFIFEGPHHILYTYQHISWLGFTALLYIVYFSTWIGYGIWNWLVSHYPIGTIVPFTLLVPIVAVLSSILFLDEPFQPWKLTAALMVISGLGINLFGRRFFAYVITKKRRAQALG